MKSHKNRMFKLKNKSRPRIKRILKKNKKARRSKKAKRRKKLRRKKLCKNNKEQKIKNKKARRSKKERKKRKVKRRRKNKKQLKKRGKSKKEAKKKIRKLQWKILPKLTSELVILSKFGNILSRKNFTAKKLMCVGRCVRLLQVFNSLSLFKI